MFKERKRNRKKLLKKTSTVSSVISAQSAAESNSASAASGAATAELDASETADGAEVAEPAAISSGSQGWSRGRIKTADESNNDFVAADASAVALGKGDCEKDITAAMGNDPVESLKSPSTKSKKKAAKRGGKKYKENEGTARGSEDKENSDEEKVSHPLL